jgi:hypothetical protein
MAEVCRQQPMVVISVCAFTDSKPNYHSQVQAYRRTPGIYSLLRLFGECPLGLLWTMVRRESAPAFSRLSVLYKDMTSLAAELAQVVLKH